MSLLLDTHILLWALYRPKEISLQWQETLAATVTPVHCRQDSRPLFRPGRVHSVRIVSLFERGSTRPSAA